MGRGEIAHMPPKLTLQEIMELGQSYTRCKTLLSAVELGVFTELAKQPLKYEALRQRLGLHPRAARDFFDALVAMGLLERDGDVYHNTDVTDLYLDKAKPTYAGGMLEMANDRLYHSWGRLTEALKTGRPQNELRETGGNLFKTIYQNPDRLRQFLKAMTASGHETAKSLARQFPWKRYRTLVDIGTAEGDLPVQVARVHPHITGGGFDLPVVQPIFEEYVSKFNLQERLKFYPGDFFTDPLPPADVICMGRILHDWDLEQKRFLLRKAYDALPSGGAVIIIETIIDDERRTHVSGLLNSLNMLLETEGGFDYTGAECMRWMHDVGFTDTYIEPLASYRSMVVGFKP